jgi:uncharacterized membrane protein YtjA (UPF0391 family)
MLPSAIACLLIALIAGVLGFGGIAGSFVGVAKILFVVFNMIRWCTVTGLVAVGTTMGLSHHIAAQQPLPPPQQQATAVGQDGVEVLTRGPVHEAFAETITFDPDPGIVVPKAPPADIEEVTPEQRPEGKNLTWIPGYWAWVGEMSIISAREFH